MARRGRTRQPIDERSLPTAEEGMREERQERIAARAHEIYEARGGEDGQDFDDWLEAEREVDLEIAKENRED